MGQHVNFNTSGVGPAQGFDTSTPVGAGRANADNLPAALRGAQLGEAQPSRLHRVGQFFGKALLTTLNICTLGIPKFIAGRVKLALLRNSEGRLDEKCQVAVAKAYKFGDLIHQISRVGVAPSRLQEHVKGFLTGMNDRLAEAMVKTGALPGGKKSAASLGEGDFEAFQMALKEFVKNVKPEELERFQRYGEVLGGIQIEAKGQDEPLRMMCATLREKLGLSDAEADMEAAQAAPVAPEQPAPQASTVAPEQTIPEAYARFETEHDLIGKSHAAFRGYLSDLEKPQLSEETFSGRLSSFVAYMKETLVSSQFLTANDVQSSEPDIRTRAMFQAMANQIGYGLFLSDSVLEIRANHADKLQALTQSNDVFTRMLATTLLTGATTPPASDPIPASTANGYATRPQVNATTQQAAPAAPEQPVEEAVPTQEELAHKAVWNGVLRDMNSGNVVRLMGYMVAPGTSKSSFDGCISRLAEHMANRMKDAGLLGDADINGRQLTEAGRKVFQEMAKEFVADMREDMQAVRTHHGAKLESVCDLSAKYFDDVTYLLAEAIRRG